MLIIFFLIVPMQIKRPKDASYYDEYDLKLRTALSKVIILSNLMVIGFYTAACLLILIKRLFFS